jgi:hypothetical protein
MTSSSNRSLVLSPCYSSLGRLLGVFAYLAPIRRPPLLRCPLGDNAGRGARLLGGRALYRFSLALLASSVRCLLGFRPGFGIPVMASLLLGQIRGLQIYSDEGVAAFDVDAARRFCFLYLGSGSSESTGGGGRRLVLPYFCEREGFFYSIPDGGVGGGCGWFRPSTVQSAVTDFCSSSYLHRTAADVRSSLSMRRGVLLHAGCCGFFKV